MSNIEFIHDVKEGKATYEAVLTDEQLHAGGLTKINAFVRSKTSANGLRVKRYKEKTEMNGIRQLNIQAPIKVHDIIKQIANRTKTDEKLTDVLTWLVHAPALPAFLAQSGARHLILVTQIGRKAISLTGWRHWLAKLIGIL